MIYFLHGKPFIPDHSSSEENHGIDVRAIKRRGEVKIKNQFGELEYRFKNSTKKR
jgi:hypothetical protein